MAIKIKQSKTGNLLTHAVARWLKRYGYSKQKPIHIKPRGKKVEVALGLPIYGAVSEDKFIDAVRQAASFSDYGIRVRPEHVFDSRSMATDHNRNNIVQRFLETNVDWLYWWDSDNTDPLGILRRLLDAERPLIGGLYVSGNPPHTPIAYMRTENGRYRNLGFKEFVLGEIIQVDAGGMHSVLMHRAVLEKIRDNYVTLFTSFGGAITVHHEDVEGTVFDQGQAPNDGKVVDGVWHTRVFEPPEYVQPAYFAQHFMRTEDYHFFELARRVGYGHAIDTSIECGHLRMHPWKLRDFNKAMEKENHESFSRQQAQFSNRLGP